MATTLSLGHMVDLALGTPEVGAVNFNVLHTLLHAILRKLDLSDVKGSIREEDRQLLSTKHSENGSPTKDGIDSDSGKDSRVESGIVSPVSGPGIRSPYHQLEDKVEKLQQQLDALNNIPSNAELFERTKSKGEGERPRPVADMWQNMQLTKKVDTNEEGINKLMSLVEDLMAEMQEVKDFNDQLKKQLEQMNNLNELSDRIKKLEDLNIEEQLKRLNELDEHNQRIKQLEDLTNEMNTRLNSYPEPDIFNDFVTWTALEESLKGIRQELQPLPPPPPVERIVVEMPTQTTPQPSRPTSAVSTRTHTPGPSAELQELLEKLGHLTTKHGKLEVRVDVIEDELKNKIDRGALEGLGTGVPTDLLDKLQNLQDELARLQKARDKLGNIENLVDQVDTVSDTMTDIKSQIADATLRLASVESMVQQVRDNQPLDPHLSTLTEEEEAPGYAILRQAVDELHRKLKDINEKVASLEQLIMMSSMQGGDTTEPQDIPSPPSPTLKASEHSAEEPKKTSKHSVEEPEKASKHSVKGPEEALETSVEGPDKKSGTAIAPGQMLVQKSSSMQQLQAKFKWLMQDVNRQLAGLNDGLSSTKSDLKKLYLRLDHQTKIHLSQTNIADVDSDALSRMQQVILQLQAEVERITNTTQQLVDENKNQQKAIDTLFHTCESLEEKKADKEFVHMEVDVKADKRHLDGKVNRSLFDETTDELNKMIADLLGKLTGKEDEWKKALGQMTDDIDGKLDRLEFGPIRDELERQLKALARKLQQLNMMQDNAGGEDDAAGIRKQLLRFHCISCDRPVDLTQQGPIPSIPAPSGLPATRSTRPYTTFELDQIRQSAKSKNPGVNAVQFERAVFERQVARCRMHNCKSALPNTIVDIQRLQQINGNQGHVDVTDMYATLRSCGGSHTLTYPHRRVTRMTHVNNLFREEDNVVSVGPVPPVKEELDIQGADGHIYRGRIDARLPNIAQPQQPGTVITTGPPRGPVSTSGSPKFLRRTQTSPVVQRQSVPMPPSNNLQATYSARPSSARLSRPSSGQPQSPPNSASRPVVPPTSVPTAENEERSGVSPLPHNDRQEPPTTTTPVPTENGNGHYE